MVVKMTELNVFKVEYYWYEGEHEEIFLAKDVNGEEFEKIYWNTPRKSERKQ